MDNLQKNLKRNVFKKVFTSLFSFLLVFVTVFLAACSINADSNTGFDSYGNLRLAAPEIEYYEKNSSGAYNSYTGSFYVPMEYYKVTYDTTDYQNTRDLAFDQSGSKAVKRSFDGHLFSDHTEFDFPDYNFFVEGMLYQVHVSVDTSKLVFKASSASEHPYLNDPANGKEYYLSTTESLSNVFRFYYREGSSGEWLDASKFVSAAYKNADGDFTTTASTGDDKKIYIRYNPFLYNGSTKRNILVKAVPNIGMHLTLNMELAPAGATADEREAYKLVDQQKTYEVQTETIVERGESLSSVQINFTANKYTFSLNAQNSIDLGYGELLVDPSTRLSVGNDYFYYVKDTTGDGKINLVSGFFPNGKLVTVERKFASASGTYEHNYAFQSWSNSVASLNSLALEGTFIDSTMTSTNDTTNKEQKYRDLENMFEVYEGGYSCIFGSKKGRSYKALVNLNSITNYFTDGQVSQYDGGYEIIYNDTSISGSRQGTFYVASDKNYNGTIFYANYVKINDFALAGSVFDADNILNEGSVNLVDYIITVYNSRNEVITKDCYGHDFEITSTVGSIPTNTFKIENLSFGDYVVFSKVVNVDGTNRSYHFYGDYMTPVSFDTSTETVNVLQNRIAKKKELIGKIVTAFNKTFYISPSDVAFMHGGRIYYLNEEGRVYNEGGEIVSGARVQYAYNVKDLTSVSILASKYEDDTSLVVNFYVYDTGSQTVIDAKDKDISYEISRF